MEVTAEIKQTPMNESKDECENCSGNMINTLLMLFLAIFLQDLNTNTLDWYWTIGMVLVIVFLFLVKRISSPDFRKAESTKVFVGKQEIKAP